MKAKITLPRQAEKYVRARLREGRYASLSDMVGRALTLMEATEKTFGAREQLLREIDVGIADFKAGRYVEWDAEAIKKRIERRAKRAS
jgi:putative addiction module CopG family antidote